MKYIIVQGDRPHNPNEKFSMRARDYDAHHDTIILDINVNDMIDKGYKPLGAPFVRHGASRGACFFQAMTRKITSRERCAKLKEEEEG